MRENNEDWKKQINLVNLEIVGLNNLVNNKFELKSIELLSKLEGLIVKEPEFDIYRKTIFDSITLLQSFKNV